MTSVMIIGLSIVVGATVVIIMQYSLNQNR
jgi:hypothetical protein